MFIGLLSVCTIEDFGKSLVSNSKRPIKFLTLNNRPSQSRPKLVDLNSDETRVYSFTVNKC